MEGADSPTKYTTNENLLMIRKDADGKVHLSPYSVEDSSQMGHSIVFNLRDGPS